MNFKLRWAALVLLNMGMVLNAVGSQPPNIIFILADDLGYGDVGVFFQNLRQAANVRSEPWHVTPELDAFAAEGTQLRRHYCPAPVCAPSRASLLLGVHQGHANVRDNQFDKALENNYTLATVLKSAGYATAAFGKWGLQGSGGNAALWPGYPTKRGFDYYYGCVRHGDGHQHYPKEDGKQVWENDTEVSADLDLCYTTDLFTARAKQWIMDHQSTNAAQPFFLYLAYDTPHAILQLPTQPYPLGGGTNGGLQWVGTPGNMISTASGIKDSYYHPDYATATWDDDSNAGSAEVAWPDVYKRYATDVRRIDDCVGDLVTLLKQLDLDTNTIVVFTSDNGPSKESYLPEAYAPDFFNSFGPHDGIKRDAWEGGIRVGALVRWPGVVISNQVSETPCSFWDWMPTFTQLAGLPAPARSDGVSLVPTLKGTGLQQTPLVYVEYFEGGNTPSYIEFAPAHRGRVRKQMQVIQHNGYKGIRYNIGSANDDFEIYDPLSDPQETNNLALNPSFSELQQVMKERVLQVRRPDPSAPRPYDSSPVPAAPNTSYTNGVLEYATFVGTWPWVPEFAAMTPVATGMVAGLDLSIRPQEDDFGVAFSGYLTVPADGDYTFYLESDSGAHFRIHEATVIDDDFNHDGAEVSGAVRLATGRHPFRLYYRHGTGPRLLTLKYSGPCISKQPVPLNKFCLAGAADPVPQTVDDCAETPRDTPVSIPVLANDTDDGAPSVLSIISVSAPRAGMAVTNGAEIFYTPEPGFLGEDVFSYEISDGQNVASALVSVTVYFQTNSVWFPFNQVRGLETLDAGGGVPASLNNFPGETAQWVEGRWNRAIEFDGSSEFLSIGGGYLPPSGTSARATAAWIRTTGTGAIVAWGPNATSRKWMMRVESAVAATGALRLEVGGGSVVGTRDLRDGQWHHVAAVLLDKPSPNASDVLLYVDGTSESLSSVSSSPINTDAVAVTVGVDAQSRYFPGLIDEVRIYSRALSGPEIAALYAATNQSAAAWHYRYFGEDPILWAADDDLDRGERLLEYGFGSEPHIVDSARMKLESAIEGDHLRVRFPRRLAGTSELSYGVQVSPDLFDWTFLTGSLVGVEPGAAAGFEEAIFEADEAVRNQSPLFMRLSITLP